MTATMASRAARGRAAAASQGPMAEIAAEALVRGNAIDAVAAAVLGAAGASPSVLLGPVQILLGGAGAGLRAIDGRSRQPGVRAKRPRGFREEDVVAPAARVATPALPAALAAALALGAGASLARALGPAIDIARTQSPARLAVLQRLARRGASALGEAAIRDELLAAAGRVAGGLLGEEDFEALLPDVMSAASHKCGALDVATVPWGADAVRKGGDVVVSASSTEVVAACDGRGLVAIACYEVAAEGLDIEALGLVAPFSAAPVRRGTPRVRPGEPRAAAAPIALASRSSLVELAAGIARAHDGESRLGDLLRAAGADAIIDQALATMPRDAQSTFVGIARSRDAARTLSDAR